MDERKSIRYWPEDERPREKLLREGEHRLSDTELLAILLRSGTRGCTAMDLARRVKQTFGTFRNMSHTDMRTWREIKGLGDAKVCQIKAAIEIGRRMIEDEKREPRQRLTDPKDVVEFMSPRMRDLKYELFRIVLLDARNGVIRVEEMEQGSVNVANPILREIFKKALEHYAVSIICVHNHPSGDPSPSPEDRSFTQSLKEAGHVLGVRVLDHIIIGDARFYSFAEEGFPLSPAPERSPGIRVRRP